jgi:hypothetical protein
MPFAYNDRTISPASVSPLPLLHDLRLKRSLPIARHVNTHLTGSVRDHRLIPAAVADIRRLAARLGSA